MCRTATGADTEETVSGEEGGKRKWSALGTAMVEDEDSRGEAENTLVGFMHLGWIKEPLFCKVVRYL